MSPSYPYPYQHLTPDEVRALIRRAHAERAEAIRGFVLALFRRKPAGGSAAEPSLDAAAYR
jgi:hypothetical protein